MEVSRKRAIKVRIDNFDVWNLDHTLALIIAPALRELRDSENGAPCVDFEDVPEWLRPDDIQKANEELGRDGTTDEFFHERWSWVLGEMIFAFECYRDDVFLTDSFIENEKENMERVKHGMKLFAKYYGSLWN